MTDDIRDDDIRRMLQAKAEEATVSPDAWEKISARIAEPERRPVGRRLALAGAAAAAVAGTAFVANLPGSPTSQVASPPEATSTAPAPATADAVTVADVWLRSRFPGADLPAGRLQGGEGGSASVVYRGTVDTEVVVRDEGEGWTVVAASSDMVPLFDVTFDGAVLEGRATPEADGEATITYLVDGDDAAGGMQPVTAREDVELSFEPPPGATTAGVRVVLAVDGTRYLSEVTAEQPADPGVRTGSPVALWPAVDADGLAELQRQADAGERDDLLDPSTVAGGFLAEVLGTDSGFGLGEFQQGDNTSGEVPYALDGGADGTVLLRRDGGDGSIWRVIGATSSSLDIVETRREETHLVADVRSSMEGTLQWTGATPVEVRSGQIVSIGRPDTPLGSHPVVVRLVQDGRTVALAGVLDPG